MEDLTATDLIAELEDAQTVLIADSHRNRQGIAQTVLLVVDADDLAAAAEAAPETVLVAALQSAREWRDVNDRPHQDLDKLRASQTILALGDVRVNATTYDEVKALAAYLGLRSKVSFLVMPAGMPLADLLAREPEHEARAALLGTLLAGATASMGQRPAALSAAARASIAPTVDPRLGLIYRGDEEGRRVLVEAAAYRLRTFRVIDDLKDPQGDNPVLVHDLEVVIVDADGRSSTHEVRGVADHQLATPRAWLNRIPGGSSVVFAAGAEDAIDGAVRHFRADQVPEIPVIKRTGWYEIEGTWGFAHPGGWLTAAGSTAFAKAQLPKAYRHLRILDTAEFSPQAEKTAALNSLEMFEELTNSNIWTGLWGGAVHTIAGLGVGGLILVAGAKGSGKTTAAQGIAAHLSAQYGPNGRAMAVIDGTPKQAAKTGVGMDCLYVFVDDMRPRRNTRAKEVQDEAFENLVRPAYAGGSARHASNEFDAATKTWELGTPDLSSPMLALIGESLPVGDGFESSLERIYPVQIAKGENIFATSNSRRFEELASTQHPQIHLAFLIRWMAEQIDQAGGKTAWVERWLAVRQEIEDSRAEMPVSTRVREVAAVPETGMRIWLTYLLQVGVIDQARFEELAELVHLTVSKAALTHGTTVVERNEVPESEALLNSLRSAVLGDEAYLEETAAANHESPHLHGVVRVPQDNERRRKIGYLARGNADTGHYLALMPREALQILSRESRFRDLTEAELLRRCKEISIRDSGKLYKTVTIYGLRNRFLAIPVSVWAPKVEGEAAE
jgi:hypothetical protein